MDTSLVAIVLLLTLIATMAIGVWAGRFIHGKAERFFVAGRSLSAGLVALALTTQAIDGNATMGVTALAHQFGFWAGAAIPIGLALSLFLLGAFVVRRLWSPRTWTLADFFEHHFSPRFSLVASLVMLFGFGILLAGNIAAVSIVIQQLFPVHYESVVIISSLAVLLYGIAGGILSDLYSDVFQFGLIVVAILGAALVFWIGPPPLVGDGWFSLAQWTDLSQGALINWATIFALGFGNLLAIDFAARVLSAKSSKEAEWGCYLGGALTLLVGVPFALIAAWIPTYTVSGSSMPVIVNLATGVFSPFFAAIFISGIVAAALSTIDGAMLSMSNIVSRNLLRIHQDVHGLSDSEQNATIIYFTRLSLVPVACAAMIFAIVFPSPGVLLTVSFDLVFAGLLVPFLMTMVVKRPIMSAIWSAFVVGMLVRIVFLVLSPTAFGVENTLWYIPNSLVPASLDGLGTFMAPLAGLIAYGIVTVSTTEQPDVSSGILVAATDLVETNHAHHERTE